MLGYDGKKNTFLKCCEKYNITRNEWTYIAPMIIEKCAFSACTVNDTDIFVCGGYDGNNRLDTIEKYDTNKNNWSILNVKL